MAKPTSRTLTGFVLLDRTGKAVLWAAESTTVIADYALRNKRIILQDDDYRAEHERLKNAGWAIRPADVVITWGPQ